MRMPPLIRAGKLASPITLKTYLGTDLGGVSVSQHLARLAAEARPSSVPSITGAHLRAPRRSLLIGIAPMW